MRHYHNNYWPIPYKLRQEKLLNSSSRVMYFNECLWIFQTFYSEKYIPVHQYIICNASWIIRNLDGRERKQLLQRDKSFQTIVLNNFLKKKNSSSLFVQIRSSKRCAEFYFKINCVVNKRQKTRIKKIPHTVLEISQINSWNFCKIELNPREFELLE